MATLLALQRVRDVPVISLPEAPARVEEVQGQDGDDDHDALEDDEVSLVLDQLALPALRELDDPVDAADEDAQRGERQCDEEPFESRGGAQAGVAGVSDLRG